MKVTKRPDQTSVALSGVAGSAGAVGGVIVSGGTAEAADGPGTGDIIVSAGEGTATWALAPAWKQPVRVATTGAGTLATSFEAGDTVDGVVLVENDRILIKDQAAAAENGIYVVGASGAPVRAGDMDEDDEVLGAMVRVIAGTANAAKVFGVTNTTEPTLGTTGIVWAEIGGSGSLTYATTSELADVAATESAGASTTVPRGDHVHRLGITTTRGDLIRRGASDNERVALGTDGQVVASDGTDAVYEWLYASITVVLGGTGSVITTGIKGSIRIPFNCTIVRASLLADVSGSAVVDIWQDTYANYPPTDADSITASAPPTISSATKAEDTTLTGWDTTLDEGSVLRYNVDSCTTITLLTVELRVRRT